MKITEIQIDGFGAWHDVQLDHLAEGLTVFYGPNEAGKTTLMEFIRSVLYGYSPERRARYLPPVAGGRGGGTLNVIGAGGRFTLRRTPASLTGDDLGRVEVLAANGSRQGQHVLGTLLAGIDEPIFKNVFAVGLRELQELGTLDDTEAAAQLYKLTSGLDRVSLIDVMRQLETARQSLLASDGSRGELLERIERRDRLQAEIQELAAGGQRWIQLAADRTALQEELARLDESIERMEREGRAVEVAIQIRDDWYQRVEATSKLEKLGKPVRLPERAVERVEELQKQIAEQRRQLEEFQGRRRVILEEVAAQPINRLLWSHAGQIEAVCEHGPWIHSLEDQTRRLQEEMGELKKTLRSQWEQLGLEPDEIPDLTPDVSNRTLGALRGPAEVLQEANQRLEEAQSARDARRNEAEELARQLREELEETGETQLAPALEKASQRVALLRRRIQVEQRAEKLDRQRKELEQERRELLEQQILPVGTLVWCGVPFVLGVAMILASFFWEWVARLGWTVTILGFACWAIAVVTKLLLERSLGQELDGCVRHWEKVKKQLRALAEDRDQLDQQLPVGGGPLDARLATAEQEVKRLEELSPLEHRHQTSLQTRETDRERIRRASDELREAQQQWRAALRSVNLPESFRPEHVRQLSEENDQTVQLGRRLQLRREELAARENDLIQVTERIEKLLKDVQITAASSDPHTQLRQLAAAMAEQRKWIARRKELRQEHRELKSSFRETAQSLRKFLRQRRALLDQAGVQDDAALRKLANRQAQIEALTRRVQELNQRIKLAIGSQCPEAAVADALETHGADRLEPYWERLLARLQDAQSRLTQLHERRGEMVQEMKTLSDDRRLDDTKLKLGCVEEQIRRAVRRWQLLGATSLLLESIRQIYETERQPETLAEASTYLVRLTDGRYQRIWTPLSEDILRIDTQSGESLPLDVLSQGTREAVFLSLRLALAAAYARRGALLPLVLDDVLVNLDVRRSRLAAEVLRDFANQGHQLLLFTCHLHILRIFQAAGVEVRSLPIRDGLDEADWADEQTILAEEQSGDQEEAIPEVAEPEALPEIEDEHPPAEEDSPGDEPQEEEDEPAEDAGSQTEAEFEEPPEPAETPAAPLEQVAHPDFEDQGSELDESSYGLWEELDEAARAEEKRAALAGLQSLPSGLRRESPWWQTEDF